MRNTEDPAQRDFRMLRRARLSRRTVLGAAACLVLGLLGLISTAEAKLLRSGPAIPRGMGVTFEAAYPAQLEATSFKSAETTVCSCFVP